MDADPSRTRARTATAPALEPVWQRLDTTYRLQARLDVRTGRTHVVETLDVRNPTDEPLIRLDLSVLAAATGEFRLASVRVDGRKVRSRWTNDANLELELDPPVRHGQARVVIAFRVQPSSDASSSLATRTSMADGIIRFGGWFPIVSDGHGFRFPGDSQVTATAGEFVLDLVTDRPVIVAAPGDPVVSTARHHVVRLRGARDLAFAVSGRFGVARHRRGGVSIEAYTTRGTGATVALRAAGHALSAFEAAYGPYPYRRFVIVQSPRSRLGNEYPGIVFLGVESLRDPVVVAHETAHQWFYGIVGSDQVREPWLHEALAEFAATDLYGRGARPCEPGPVASPVTAFPNRRATLACGGYGDTVYRGGAALVATVRGLLGAERFDLAMRRYVAGHAGRIATTDDLVGAWLAVADDQARLRAVIEQALYGAGAPPTTARGAPRAASRDAGSPGRAAGRGL